MYEDLSPTMTLDNGLSLMLHNCPDHPGIHVRANVRIGSCDERLPRDKGICNLIERLCWRGGEKMPINKVMDESSLGGGRSGGSVGRTFTTYHTWSPDGYLPNGLELLDNIIFRPSMEAEDLEAEKRLAIMRIGMEECEPVSYATQMALANLYPKHRVAFGMLGTPETVTNMKVTRMRELVRGSHRPQTITLGLSGNLPRFEELEEILGEHAGGFIEKTRAANAIPLDREWGDSAPADEISESESWGYREDWTTVIIYLVPSGLLGENGWNVMSIICNLIGNRKSSILWQKMVMSSNPVAHDISADFEWLDGIAWIRIVIRSTGERGDEIAQMVKKTLDSWAGKSDPENLTFCKQSVRSDMLMAFSDPGEKLRIDMEWNSLYTKRWAPDMDLKNVLSTGKQAIMETKKAIFSSPSSTYSIAR